ncbi:MAG: TlpA disulfide reductase family protein [Vicinamibacterales bacterium]
MTHRYRFAAARALSVFAVIASVIASSGSPARADARTSTRPAPAMKLPTDTGAVVDLSSLRGQVVLVDMWASWCVPCRASFPALDALYRDYHKRGLEVLAVNVDERRKDADAFLAQRPHQMPVLFDPKGTAPEAFGVQGMPTSFLIDRQGTIRFVHEGYTDKALATYREQIEALLKER